MSTCGYDIKIIDKGMMEKLLPHRGNALKLDEATFFVSRCPSPKRWLIGIKEIRINDPDLDGHFSDRPIYPGHCLIECACLSAALLAKMSYPEMEGVPVIAGIDRIRFFAFADPFQNSFLIFHTVLKRNMRQKIFIFDCVVRKRKQEKIAIIENLKGVAF